MVNKIFRIYGVIAVIILLSCSTVLGQFTLSPSGTVNTAYTTFTMTGSVTGVSYQIRNSSGIIPGVNPVIGTGAPISFSNVPTNVSGAFTVINSGNVQVAGTYIFVCLMPDAANWHVNASSTVLNGSSVIFTVQPSSPPTNPDYTPNTYTWYRNNTLISGQTSSTLTISSIGQYTVVVGFRCGNITLSCPALTEQFTLSPSGNVFTTSTAFTMSGSSVGETYQLRNSSGAIPGVSSVTGTGSAISFMNVPTNASGTFSVLNANSAQVVAGTYIFACPVINPSNWYVRASSGTILNGVPVTFYVSPVSPPTNPDYFPNTYIWYNNNVVIPGQTASSLTISIPGQYTVAVGFKCSNITLSCPAVNEVITAPGTISPTSLSVVLGMVSAVPLIGTIPTEPAVYTYQWQRSTDQSLWTDIGGATSNNYSPMASAVVGSITYYRRVIYKNGTNVGNSNVSAVSTTPNCIPLATNINANQNYILTSTPRIGGFISNSSFINRNICELMQAVQYYDGLGRPLQTVQVKGSPSGKDIVQPIAYDAFGREPVKYQPYAQTMGNSDGSYKTNAFTAQPAFYTTPPSGVSAIPNPYSVTVFEPSPLNRVTEQGAPGAAWQPNNSNADLGHTNRTAYGANDVTAIGTIASTNKVMLYSVTIATDGTRTLVNAGTSAYEAGQLYVTQIKDENWQGADRAGTIQEFKDKQERVVLKRAFNKKADNSIEMLSTYYVYDDLGNLCYVLPPGALPDGGTISTATLTNYCYQYRYDERNRLSQKKLPGKGWEYIVYNKLDQPVLNQDANQRTANQWMVTKYDVLGRAILTGLWNAGSVISQSTLQASIYAGVQWDSRDDTNNTTANPSGYVLSSYPGLSKILTINYYDDYLNIPGIPAAFIVSGNSNMTRGLLTTIKTAVLNTIANATPDYLWTVTYYDDEGRNIKTYKQHYLGGVASPYNYDEISTIYSFTGQVTGTTRKHHTKNAANTAAVLAATVANSYEYDHMGRKTNTWEQINTDAKVLLSQNAYNEIGQLWTKKLHSENNGSSFLESVTNTYNERGWLLSSNSNSNLFNYNLSYNQPSDVSASPQYNGNIAQMNYVTTKVSTPGARQFVYRYDQLNRLTNAASTGNQLNEAISYNLMGNITGLTRGGTGAGALNYTYNGNQLTTVSGYSPRSYTYDPNGNANSDGGSKTITYNMLNLPQEVKQGTTPLATYTYDATGSKLRNTGSAGSWDYIDGIIYNNNAIAFIQTEEGRADPIDGTYKYQYNLKDHLGNTRVCIDKFNNTARVLQEDEYYSFGLRKPAGYDFSNSNRYLYNGKEIQADLTNQYDYGARFYDPVVGRFTTIDPLAEKMRRFSPYNHAFNNPLRFVDPDGMAPTDVIIGGVDKDKAFAELQKSVAGQLNLSMDANGKVTYAKVAPDPLIGDESKQLVSAIDDHSVTVNATATNQTRNANGGVVFGEFHGNTVTPSATGGKPTVVADQLLNPTLLSKTDAPFGANKAGDNTLHEITEAYQGALNAQASGVSTPLPARGDENNPNSAYRRAHDAAVHQVGDITLTFYDQWRQPSGSWTYNGQPVRSEYTVQPPGKTPVVVFSLP